MPDHKTLVVLTVIVILARLGLEEDSFDTCNRYTSFGYGYRDLFEYRSGNNSPNQVSYLEFYVKTTSDAHILLKPDDTGADAYEIVIGGGSNTFSQIRLIQPETKQTMITQKTENFLSGDNYRQFWISLDKLGVLSVGKKEGDEVFINWRFDDPFPIKYFSFGSWTNMKADWRFGCKNGSGIVLDEGGMKPLRKLKRDLFTLYDPNALPVDKKSILEVRVNFQINNVFLNEKRGEFTMYGTGDLKWTDVKMRWKPEDYAGIENIFVPPFQIWTPSIRVLNALATDGAQLFDLTTSGVVAKYDGSVFWRAPFKSVSHCTVDLTYWPYDIHNCSVFFGFWMEPSNLILSMMEEYDTVPEQRTESEWKILRAIPFNTHNANDEGNPDNVGFLYVEMKREFGLEETVLLTPYLASLFLTLISFWLPFQSSLKLHLIFGSLFLLILTLFLSGALVPAMTQGVPKIIDLYSWTIVINCFPVLLYVVLKNVPDNLEIPEPLSKVFNNGLFVEIFCLPKVSAIASEYSNFNEEVNKLNRNRLNSMRLVTVIERLSFLGYLSANILFCLLT